MWIILIICLVVYLYEDSVEKEKREKEARRKALEEKARLNGSSNRYTQKVYTNVARQTVDGKAEKSGHTWEQTYQKLEAYDAAEREKYLAKRKEEQIAYDRLAKDSGLVAMTQARAVGTEDERPAEYENTSAAGKRRRKLV